MTNEELTKILSKPFEPTPRVDGIIYGCDAFDPWEDVIDCVYGSYSDDFDKMAIAVLIDIRDHTYKENSLAANMIREMLCRLGFCDYGSSPRVCFWSLDVELLDRLISKWRDYSSLYWSHD